MSVSLAGSGINVFYAVVQGYPWYLVLIFAASGLLLALWLVSGVISYVRHKGAVAEQSTEPQPTEPEQSPTERTGWRSRGDSIRVRRLRIRDQDTSIDSENTDWDAEDTDIK
jgi:hypothetical protein